MRQVTDVRTRATARSMLIALLIVGAMTTTPRTAGALSYVSVEGDKVDENGQAFTDPQAIVDPYGLGSTCGPDAAAQSPSSRACGGTVSHYVARTYVYKKGYIKMIARTPRGRDLVVSVCTGSNATFGCRQHPGDSFCRPKQSSTVAKIDVWLPPALPPFIDIKWSYIPESQAGNYPACDKKRGPYAAKVLSADLNLDFHLGDNDGSGAVTVTDGVQVLRCAAGLGQCSLVRADIDCNGLISVTDGVNVLRLAAGLPIHAGCDRDGDGLLDEWEEFGYDADGDGVVDIPLNKAPYNANAFRKDVFVECDYMRASDHTHQPLQGAIGKAVTVFANGPGQNLDSTPGVVLHIDAGSMGGGTEIPHTTVLQPDSCDTLHQLRNTYMAPSRRSIFHYCVFVHFDDADPLRRHGGRNCDDDRSEFYISLGEETSGGRSDQNQAAAFVHELGHDFGLRHGGFENDNHKPNYLSIMNYFFSYGLVFANGTRGLDYSRFEVMKLDENHLNETTGLHAVGGDGQLAGYGTRWFDTVHGDNPQTQFDVLTNIDWNGTGGNAETSVQVNLNHENGTSELASWNDWQNLRFDKGTIGAIGTVASDWSAFDQPVDVSCDDFPLP